jgi:mRNA interferase RelE/StbE
MTPKYEIIFSKGAWRRFKKLNPDAKNQIEKAIANLADNPRPQSCKRMKGKYKGYWRERTGDYRIIYEIREQQLLIVVVGVGHRKSIY